MSDNLLNINPIEFYEFMILEPMSIVYSGIDKSKLDEIDTYATMLIDKFAIHSSSYFHLSKGLFKPKPINEKYKSYAYDLFSTNSIFRTIMETYSTFNNIFIEPSSYSEKHFRFCLWKLDGLNEKLKFNFKITDFDDAQRIIEQDKKELNKLICEFEQLEFFKNLVEKERNKIYSCENKKFNWRFLVRDEKIVPLTITSLIEHTCPSRGFINTYRFTSTHAHSTYLAIKHFEKYRGRNLSDEYVNAPLNLAIFITCMMIYDMKLFNGGAESEFNKLDKTLQDYIIGMTNGIKRKNETCS